MSKYMIDNADNGFANLLNEIEKKSSKGKLERWCNCKNLVEEENGFLAPSVSYYLLCSLRLQCCYYGSDLTLDMPQFHLIHF